MKRRAEAPQSLAEGDDDYLGSSFRIPLFVSLTIGLKNVFCDG